MIGEINKYLFGFWIIDLQFPCVHMRKKKFCSIKIPHYYTKCTKKGDPRDCNDYIKKCIANVTYKTLVYCIKDKLKFYTEEWLKDSTKVVLDYTGYILSM